MKFYNSIGPNPRLVRLFMAEKGIEIADQAQIDIMGGENRKAPYTDINPSGQMPCLVTDDGTAIAETIDERDATAAGILSTLALVPDNDPPGVDRSDDHSTGS